MGMKGKADTLRRGKCSAVKRKRAEYCAVLKVDVDCATAIDRPFTLDRRIYRAEFCVEPDYVFVTDSILCKGNPRWENSGIIPLRRPHGFLYVEVVKSHCKIDPSTSTGEVVVGRCRIPLPGGFNRQIRRLAHLTKLEGQERISAGKILISMEMQELIEKSQL